MRIQNRLLILWGSTSEGRADAGGGCKQLGGGCPRGRTAAPNDCPVPDAGRSGGPAEARAGSQAVREGAGPILEAGRRRHERSARPGLARPVADAAPGLPLAKTTAASAGLGPPSAQEFSCAQLLHDVLTTAADNSASGSAGSDDSTTQHAPPSGGWRRMGLLQPGKGPRPVESQVELRAHQSRQEQSRRHRKDVGLVRAPELVFGLRSVRDKGQRSTEYLLNTWVSNAYHL